jgi:hypothetical protein
MGSLAEPEFLRMFTAWEENVMKYQEEHFRREN